MLVEGTEVSRDIDCDVCVIGAGAAGITIALQLRNSGLDVVLTESGGLEPESDTQALYRSFQTGISTDKLHRNRLRYFGGTTGHWGGWCRPLDDVDFERRPWVPYSGWPFSRSELSRFYPRAHELCEIDRPSYDPARWTSPEDRERGVLLSGDVLRNVVFHISDPPTRFGTRYRQDLETAANITMSLHSTAMDIETDDDARHVTAIKVGTLAGTRFRIRARHYVLAAGAVENTRILLSSSSVQSTGLGNANDLVGRFFGQHPCYRKTHWVVGEDILRRLARQGTRHDVWIATGLSEQAVCENEILNYHFLHPHYLQRKFELGFFRRLYERLRGEPGREELRDAVGDLVSDIGGPPANQWRRFILIEERPEQAPNPSSRVVLSDERDALGMQRVEMDWRLCDLDLFTVRRARELLVRAFGMAGMGRVRGWPDGYDPAKPMAEFLHGGHHHFGTTRMHEDPRQGVVDASCRMHGVDNLYVAGGSVFPTTGFANPTLTIVALAVRLAETIREL